MHLFFGREKIDESIVFLGYPVFRYCKFACRWTSRVACFLSFVWSPWRFRRTFCRIGVQRCTQRAPEVSYWSSCSARQPLAACKFPQKLWARLLHKLYQHILCIYFYTYIHLYRMIWVIYLENPEAGNDDIWGEFNPKLAANLTLAYINASVAVGSLEVLDTANLLTLSLGKLWRLSFPGMRLKILSW